MRTQVVEMRTAIRGLALSAAICGMAENLPVMRAQDVSLEMRTRDGGSAYHVGEPIDLQLVFSSASKQYLVDSSFSYPQRQTAPDAFLVDPKGGSEDPMVDYRQALSSNRYFDTGGLRGIARLGDKPVVLDLPLNRYVRFTKPGHYVLRLSDRRVTRARTSIDELSQPVEITAKPLQLTIVTADVAWQKEQLKLALEALKKGPGVNVHACEILESLGTLESEIAMADGLADENVAVGCSFAYSLLGARNRKVVLEHMQQSLESPTEKVNSQFVETMATLKTLEEGGETEFYQRQAEAHKTVSAALFATLDEKKGPARIAAISTLVNESLMVPGNENPARDKQVLGLAAEVFEQLNSQAQNTLLSAKWNQIAGPAMVPVLRRCAEADNTEICGYGGELLLARLNELSPSDAREVILADVQKESPRFPSRVLAMLPDKELSELDGVLGERLAAKTGNLDTTGGLIQRYASGGISGAVLQFLHENEPGKMGGEIEANLIAYLFRAQPDAAEQKLREALAAREGTASYKYVLREVAQRTQDARLQPIAIQALGDEDHDVVLSAVQALGFVGDERGKAALFQRLEEWSAKWMGQQDRLFWIPGDEPITDDRYLGYELMRAIGSGDGWLMTVEDQQRLLRAAVDQNLKQTAKQFIEAARERPVPITVNDAGSPNVQIVAGQYNYENVARLEHKLAQFPAGTSFAMRCALAGTAAETQKASAEIEAYLTHAGMRVSACKVQ